MLCCAGASIHSFMACADSDSNFISRRSRSALCSLFELVSCMSLRMTHLRLGEHDKLVPTYIWIRICPQACPDIFTCGCTSGSFSTEQLQGPSHAWNSWYNTIMMDDFTVIFRARSCQEITNALRDVSLYVERIRMWIHGWPAWWIWLLLVTSLVANRLQTMMENHSKILGNSCKRKAWWIGINACEYPGTLLLTLVTGRRNSRTKAPLERRPQLWLRRSHEN